MCSRQFPLIFNCLLVLSTPFFGACSSDSGGESSDTATDTSRDTPSGDPNVDTGTDEGNNSDPITDPVADAPSSQCVSAGGSCNPNTAQSPPWVCVDNGDGTGFCATTCTDYTECGAGTYCTEGSFCYDSECSGFFDAATCPDNSRCVPAGYSAYTCDSIGSGAAGDPCELDSECADGLLCIGGLCSAPDCNPLTGTPGCTGDATCEAASIDGFSFDFGFCVEECEAFENDDCSGDHWCFPVERSSSSGMIEGVCVETDGGTVPDGDSCTAEGVACLDGSLCIGSETEAFCRQFCDPLSGTSGSGACGDDELCAGLIDTDGNPLVFGACFPACTPYVDNSESGCDAATEWCFPDQSQSGVGQCTPNGTGTAQESDLCGDDYDNSGSIGNNETCAASLICLAFTDTEARCVDLCDPDATSGTDGHCGTECTCRGLQIDDDPIAFGYVEETCIFNHGGARVECTTWGTCVPGETFGSTDDICVQGVPSPGLAELDNCTTAGLAEFDLCSESGICLVVSELGGPDVLCYDLCMTSEGAFNTSNHPDCTRTSVVCSQLFDSTEFGICGTDA